MNAPDTRESLGVDRLCEVCQEPCDDREAWATALDGDVAHHTCLRDVGVCGTLIDCRPKVSVILRG